MREFIYNAPQEIVNLITIITGVPNLAVSIMKIFKKCSDKQYKFNKSFWIPLITGLLIVFFYILFGILKNNMARVPELNGWTYHNAIQTLDERNISYEFVTDNFDRDTAKISYQSYGNNEIIYSWEKLVLGTSDEPEKPSTQTTSTTATTTPSLNNTSANNTTNTNYSSEPSQESPANDKTSSDGEPYEITLYADNKDGKWGFVDQYGTEQMPYIYDWANDFIDGYAAVRKNYSWGIIDTAGNVVIPFEYDGAFSFINGLAPVYLNAKWGFIDINGDVKIPFKFRNISMITSGTECYFVDENNNIIDYDAEFSSVQ